MAINKKKVEPYRHVEMRKEAHANFMGGPSYDISSPLLRLICMSASSFFGEPSYYKGDAPKFKKGRSGQAARMLNHQILNVIFLKTTIAMFVKMFMMT